MSGTDVAGDVPGKYDVVIDGYGYVTARAVDPNLPFRVQQESFSYTPTFLERTNVSGAYSDNQQDFFLTASQNDWSGGEDQRFFRANSASSKNRYWLSSNIDLSVPGQAKIGPATKTVTFAAAVSGVGSNQVNLFAASSTNLYEYDGSTITDRGAHGAGALPTSIAYDGQYVYLAGFGTSALRRYDTAAHTFSSFSASAQLWVTFLNNSLWGTTSALNYFSTAGAASAAYTWQNALGGALANTKKIIAFGGQIAALLPVAQNVKGAELWIGDTTGARRVAELPGNFLEKALCQANGIIFVIGTEAKSSIEMRTCVYYYANGTLDRLWASPTWTTNVGSIGGQDIVPYREGVVFTDVVTSTLKFYNLGTGAISSIAAWTPSTSDVYFGASRTTPAILMTQNATTATYLFDSVIASTATISSSLIDFDNGLSKLMRGIKVDWAPGTDGNGGSVDISYQIDSLDGAYTSLQASAVSGTEYALSGVTGHSISVKITLNKGTSTFGPTLKRVYVRAAPVLQAYRINSFILDLGGSYQNPVRRRDDSEHTLSGEEMRANLAASITSQTPISITDITGTYTGVLEPSQCEFDTNRPSQYYARIQTREV